MSGIYISGMEMPECCDNCWALDDHGDYPRCRITEEQRGYKFPIREKRMYKCPLVEVIQAADIQPVRRGQWELDVLDGTPGYRPICIVCSECHRISYSRFPYCPNCGIKMEKDNG